jgi:hypothetical protein
MKPIVLIMLYSCSLFAATKLTSKNFLKLQQKYSSKNFPSKKSNGAHIWTQIVSGIKQFNDKKMYTEVIKHYPTQGSDFEHYRIDLKTLFIHNPLLTINIVNDVYPSATQCYLFKLLPTTEQVKYKNIRPHLNKTIKKLRLDKNKKDLMIAEAFREKADLHYKMIKSGKPYLDVKVCLNLASR